MSDSTLGRHGRLILIPALITLAVTLLRLVGELQQWSSTLFSREAGGGGALIGIVWLIPIFGIYFALKLSGAGEGPGRVLRGVGLCILAFVVMVLTGIGATALGLDPNGRSTLVVFIVAAIVSGLMAFKAWPALGRVLFAYGLAARVPVAIVMLLAILGQWGTHYDVPPSPEFPAMAPVALWFWIGFLPQMTIWISFTMMMGTLFGLVAAAIATRGHRAQAA
jgi:hypothetical protein